MVRASFGGRSFFRGYSGGGGGRSRSRSRSRSSKDRETVATGAHFSKTSSNYYEDEDEFEYENEKDFRCKYYYNLLQKNMADAEAVDGDCLGCESFKEKMSDCPGVEKLKFKREGSLSEEDLKKLTKKERWCRLLIQHFKRATRDAERIGIECNSCDSYMADIVELGCAGMEGLKEEGA